MQFPEYSKRIEALIDGAQAEVNGEGNKLEARVISSVFSGLSSVKRHQMIYKIFNAELSSGIIHALTIKAYTPEEWQQTH